MRVKTWVDLGSQEVDVDVTAEEILAAFTSNDDGYSEEVWMRRVCNNTGIFFGKVSDDLIAKQSPEFRKTVADFFENQAKRFRA